MMCKKIIRSTVLLTLPFAASACVTLAGKIEESDAVDARAKATGFVKGAQDAVSLDAKNSCSPATTTKWDLKFDKSTPLIEQQDAAKKVAYAPFHVICFMPTKSGALKIKFTTKHQGGGYSKAYYLLPYVYLFGKKSQVVMPVGKPTVTQAPWTGDYVLTADFNVEKDQPFRLVVESYNLESDRPWSQYPNYAMGVTSELFPIAVYPSIYGEVTVELVAPNS